jgi:hypothetical protein
MAFVVANVRLLDRESHVWQWSGQFVTRRSAVLTANSAAFTKLFVDFPVFAMAQNNDFLSQYRSTVLRGKCCM